MGTLERVQQPAQQSVPYIVSDRNGIDPNDGQTSMEEIAAGFLQTLQKPSAPQAEGSQDNASGSYYHTRNALQDAERRQLEWRNGERGFASYAISSLYHGALVLPADFLYDSAAVISSNLVASSEYVGIKAAQPIRSYLGKETYEVRYSDILEKQYEIANSTGMRTAVDLVNPADFAGKVKGVKFAADTARTLPDSALVCRGGTCSAENFVNGNGVTRASDGKLSGVSTQSRAGASVEELSKPFKNNQVGVTTAGEIRQAGGEITPDGHRTNPNHATVDGLTEQQLESLFNPTIQNPVPLDLRGR